MEFGPLASVCVRQSDTHGLGVFATAAIEADTVVEHAPVLDTMVRMTRRRPYPDMHRYSYTWPAHPYVQFMAAGFATMYNDGHRCCNVRWELDMDCRRLSFYAIRDIEPGEELTIDYHQCSRPDILRTADFVA